TTSPADGGVGPGAAVRSAGVRLRPGQFVKVEVTARRYLEHLVGLGRAARRPHYGQVGRPELHYRWVPQAR
ncbi:hypothetical protein ACWD3D_36950, partial [Streptomyces sp. NPDC002690]